MPNAKTLAVGLAIVTILGFTVAMAVPMGPSLSDDDPENSGVTSAQEPGTNETGNQSQTGPNGNSSNGENGSAGGNGSGGNGSDGGSAGDGGESGSGDGADDQDGEKNKDGDGSDGDDCDCEENGSSDDSGDGADDQDGSKDKDGEDGSGDGDGNGDTGDGNGDNGDDGDTGDGDGDTGDGDGDNGGDGDGENGDELSTCEQGGLLLNNTLANELFDTENESGPISGVIHENEHYFMQGGVIIHESGCVVATVDNAANGSNPGDQIPGVGNDSEDGTDGNNSDDGTTGNETDGENGTDGGSELGTCEAGGAIQEATLANLLFGTMNEEGPISSSIHENEDLFMQGNMIVHETGCIVATVDNNAPGGGGLPGAP